jgi:hypothetical protein
MSSGNPRRTASPLLVVGLEHSNRPQAGEVSRGFGLRGKKSQRGDFLMKAAGDWWRTFFSGPMVAGWLKALPEEETRKARRRRAAASGPSACPPAQF